MRDGTERTVLNDRVLASVLTVLSTGVVLFLVPPTTSAMGSVPRANLYLAVPFAFVAIAFLPLVLESLSGDDADESARRDGAGRDVDLERDARSRSR